MSTHRLLGVLCSPLRGSEGLGENFREKLLQPPALITWPVPQAVFFSQVPLQVREALRAGHVSSWGYA